MALVADHKSSRSPLKSGCRTLPAADLPGTRVPPAMTVQPDAAMRDALAVGLGFPDQRLEQSTRNGRAVFLQIEQY
jgi:hypothetical protein